jgi:hypothetical protein
VASFTGAAVGYVIARAFGFDDGQNPGAVGLMSGVIGVALIFNVLPDYMSLLETRWMIRFARSGRALVAVLIVDLVLTSLIILGWALMFAIAAQVLTGLQISEGSARNLGYMLGLTLGVFSQGNLAVIFGVLLSTFFTSLWLWLYAISVPISRLLLSMKNGVGFLLRVTDVEKQPFRSMGFVSVIIVSGLFLLGLPWVLL